jgi:CRP/FNR family transcriptional regulator, cyclic AMP receptor protein
VIITRDIADMVKSHPVLAGLPDDVLDELTGCARNLAFESGALLLVEGERADSLYLVRRGRVSIEVHSPTGHNLVVETVGVGAAVGWSWIVPPYTWQFDARAVERVGVIALDGACLRAKADADSSLGYTLMRRVAGVLLERLHATQLRLLDLYKVPNAC